MEKQPTRKCCTCKKELPLSAFHKSRRSKDGLASRCKRGVCAICEKPEMVSGRRLAIDHNHKTGKIRGLLCSRCNMFLGQLEADEKLTRKILDYIKND